MWFNRLAEGILQERRTLLEKEQWSFTLDIFFNLVVNEDNVSVIKPIILVDIKFNAHDVFLK